MGHGTRRRDRRVEAAELARWLAFLHGAVRGNMAAANGWMARAGSLLEGMEECVAHGWLTLDRAPFTNDSAERERLATAALAIAKRFGGIGSGFAFLLDLGLFHDELTDGQRAAMGREVTAVAAPGATLLMVAWVPRRRGPLPRGASRADIEAAYPAWKVIDEERVDLSEAPLYRVVRNADPRLYRLRLD